MRLRRAGEFIKRDLFNPDIVNLSQLEWRIKGMKLSKAKALEYLKSIEGKTALDNQKIIKLFDTFAEKINYNKDITNVNEMLEFLETNNEWYNLIFK